MTTVKHETEIVADTEVPVIRVSREFEAPAAKVALPRMPRRRELTPRRQPLLPRRRRMLRPHRVQVPHQQPRQAAEVDEVVAERRHTHRPTGSSCRYSPMGRSR